MSIRMMPMSFAFSRFPRMVRDIAAKLGKDADLVLLDLSMPGLGGVETFRLLREVDPKVPLILSSGFAQEEVLTQVKGMDLAGFLQKPYLAKDLIRTVESAPVRSGS